LDAVQPVLHIPFQPRSGENTSRRPEIEVRFARRTLSLGCGI